MARKDGLYSTFVGAIPLSVSNDEVKELFSVCGLIENMYIAHSEKTDDKYGFIRYSTAEEVIRAVSHFDRQFIKGKRLIVDYAKDTIDRINEYKETQCKTKIEASKQNKEHLHESRLNFYSVYVGHVHPDVTKREIQDLFSSCGCIDDMFLNAHEDSGNQYGFVRYSRVENAMNAVKNLDGNRLKERCISVQYAHDTVDRIPKDAELTKHTLIIEPEKNKNLSQINNSAAISTTTVKSYDRRDKQTYYSAYVGNLHPDITTKEIKDLFSGCGLVKDMYINEDGAQHKFGFIRFSNAQDVTNAMSHLNGWRIKNRPLIVDIAHDTVGRLGKGKGMQSIVPRVNPSLHTGGRLAGRSSEINSVINRSRLHEAYSIVRFKTCASKGLAGFNHILEQVDSRVFTSKCSSFHLDVSHKSNPSTQGVSDHVESQINQLTSEILMDKVKEVSKTLKQLMNGATKSVSARRRSPQQLNQRTTNYVLNKTEISSSNKSNDKLESRFMKDLKDSPTPAALNKFSSKFSQSESANNNPSPSRAVMSGSTLCRLGGRGRQTLPYASSPSRCNKDDDNIPLVERGRRLRKQMNRENVIYRKEVVSEIEQRNKEIGSDRSEINSEFVQNNKRSFKPKELLQDFISPEKDYQHELEEGWGKHQPRSSWASDLFCKFLDSESSPTSNKAGSDCSSSSSSSSISESCSIPDSSGYSSYCDYLEVDSTSGNVKSSRRQNGSKGQDTGTNINKLKEIVKKSEGKCILSKSRLFNM